MNHEAEIVPQAGGQDRHIIAIHIEAVTNRRLLESIAIQLNLRPRFAEDNDLRDEEFIAEVALIVADEAAASRYRALPTIPDPPGDGTQPALVAVLPATYSGNPLLPRGKDQQPFDGILVLPQLPAVVLAQLSVILYAHRSSTRQYNNALDELQLNRRIFRSVTSGISIANASEPDLPLSYVNPAFEVITGYSLEEVAGKNCRFLQGSERNQPGLVLIREAIANQRPTVAIVKNYKKDGTPFWNELSMSPIFDRDGRLTHYVGIQNDVTARVAFEEALRESEKLAATGRLAASIAHEINNPLEAVMNLLYLAETGTSIRQKDEYIRQASDELRRVSEITTQSLKFYRQSSKPKAVRVVDIVTAVLNVYSVKMTSWRIDADKQYRSNDSIVCLESEIRQVLSNLVKNAMDAMRGPGGTLVVRVRNATRWTDDSKGIAITVADHGTGMSEETQKKLFQAFYTTKERHGTGLGLWVSQEIVARHRGKLTCRSSQSSKGSGAVFTLFLPFQASR